MKLTFNPVADAIYLSLPDNAAVHESREIGPGVVADFDRDGQVVGIEVLSVSRIATESELSRLAIDSSPRRIEEPDNGAHRQWLLQKPHCG